MSPQFMKISQKYKAGNPLICCGPFICGEKLVAKWQFLHPITSSPNQSLSKFPTYQPILYFIPFF